MRQSKAKEHGELHRASWRGRWRGLDGRLGKCGNLRIAASEVQLSLNRGEKQCTYYGALVYALACALPLGFVVVCRCRFLSGCCRGFSTTSSREEAACSLRVATDEREPREGKHTKFEWASCARAGRPT